MDNEKIVQRLVQEGIVTAVSSSRRTARVKFPATDIQSDWLYVLQHGGTCGRAEPANGHTHNVAMGTWLPAVNDRVLVLYLPVPEGDGFILGVVS